jgi:UDP-N-acetylmuramate--alanine ligase
MRMTPPPSLGGRAVARIHCLGAGGMGVAPLAIYLAGLGFTVSGEDDAQNPEVDAQLARAGVARRGLPDACDLVVYSSAIARSHPSFALAATRGVPLVRRGTALAQAVAGRKLVAICGAHGKTTTTAMLITALRKAEFPAGYILGGLFADGESPARAGSNDWVVAEIDESDGTIDDFSPEITVAVNLDWDHPDTYRRPEDFDAAFAALFARTRGAVLISDACARSLRVAAERREGAGPVLSFGRSGDFSAVAAEEKGERTRLRLGGRFTIAEAQLRARGEFNVANAAGALAAAALMGAPVEFRALADYAGVRRRQTVLASDGGVTVLEDYAHHPAEIRALLGSLRGRVGENGRLIVVFQPHRYSRTLQFAAEFAAALALADRVHLLDVYAAGETPIAGGTSADVYAEMRRGPAGAAVSYFPGGGPELFRALAREVRRGDWVAFVGAGDIDRQARVWLEERLALTEQDRRWDAAAAALQALVSPATQLRREEPLARKTTLRVGGAARIYAEPANAEDLAALVRGAGAAQLGHWLLGRGSNLIVPDAGVDGLVISLAHETWSRFERRADGLLWVGAGLRLKNLCGLAAQAGLAGFEFLEGIPGSVGGALRMNAGAMGGGMFDVVEEVQLMDGAGTIRMLAKAQMHVAYRRCAELEEATALGALLRPPGRTAAAAISGQIETYRSRRHATQPREPSAGCIFKNPAGTSAGRLIEESGLKGERVGDAEVSSVHANFIVNRGQATSAEVLELIRRVRAQVRRARGVELEPEVLLYGQAWKEVL